jgi:hypothetical protein
MRVLELESDLMADATTAPYTVSPAWLFKEDNDARTSTTRCIIGERAQARHPRLCTSQCVCRFCSISLALHMGGE